MRDRKTLINHIRAAKDWLSEADNSLSNKDDVSGDLKLMLAEAEIQRAKERVPISRRTKRVINFVAVFLGVALALAVWFLFKENSTENANMKVTESLTREIEATKDTSQYPSEEPSSTSFETHKDVAVEEKNIKPEEITPKEETSLINERQNQEQQQASSERKEQSLEQTEVTPSDEMQKLMESAGKVLRK